MAVVLDVTSPSRRPGRGGDGGGPVRFDRCAREQRRLRHQRLDRGLSRGRVPRAGRGESLYGVVNLAWPVLPVMRGPAVRAHRADVVHRRTLSGTPGLSAYQTAKFAVEGFSRCWRMRWPRSASRPPSSSPAASTRAGRGGAVRSRHLRLRGDGRRVAREVRRVRRQRAG